MRTHHLNPGFSVAAGNRARAGRRLAACVVSVGLVLGATACGSDRPSGPGLSRHSNSAANSPVIPGGLGSSNEQVSPTADGTDSASSSGFDLTFDRTTDQGYKYALSVTGSVGDLGVDPNYAPVGQTIVTKALDFSTLTLTNNSGRIMDTGQDQMQIGGLGIVAAWPADSEICRVFASQWALPDGRCGGGLGDLYLEDRSSITIPADGPQSLTLHSPPTGKSSLLAFQVDDTPAATNTMQTALSDAVICLVVVKPGTSDANHTPGFVRAAACSA